MSFHNHTSHDFSVQFNNASYTWPDGSRVLEEASVTFGRGRIGLIGANGAGKSTVLRLIAGELSPTSGTVTASGDVGYLTQEVTLQTGATLADLLGIAPKLVALRAIESGDVSEQHFDTLGDDWEVETRAAEALRAAGLGRNDDGSPQLDRPVSELSGGETVLAAIAGVKMAGSPIVLMDEPTNNLDYESRQRLYRMIETWNGTLIVVSHDPTLLDLMDETVELRQAQLTVFGGNFSDYRAFLEQEQGAAKRALRAAEQTLKTERAQRAETATNIARRQRHAKTDHANKRKPKIVMNQRKSDAQVSAGKQQGRAEAALGEAQARVVKLEENIRAEVRIRIELPDPGVSTSKRLLTLTDGDRSFLLQGQERVALTGANGVGKTRLIEQVVYPNRVGTETPHPGPTGTLHTERVGYLAQRLDGLDEELSIMDNVQATAPGVAPEAARARLARFMFRGDQVDRPVRQLSGGERFRVVLARLLLADPPAQLLIMDEPTNSLDQESVDALVSALDTYRGGLLVVSHDEAFLNRLGLSDWLTIHHDGRLEIGHP